MKIAFLLMCVLLLNACTNSFLTDELPSNSSDFDVFYKTQSGNQNYINITDSTLDSYKISYQLGATPPDDCSNSVITASGPGEVLIPSLTGGQRYSFRVCRSNGQSKTLSFVTGNLTVEDKHTNTTNLWNMWLKNSDSTQLCDDSVSYMDECFHASEVKKVETSNFDSCTDLELTDSLGFFDWSCNVVSEKAVFTSKLKEDTLFKDMITAGAFKPNKVVLKHKDKQINESNLSSWWSNDFVEIIGSTAFTGSSNNTVYFVDENIDFLNTVNIDGVNSVLVTLSGAEISGTATTTNSIELGGTSQFTWVEVNLQSDGTADGIRLGGKLQYVRHSTLSGANDDCVFIPGGVERKMLVTHSTISGCNYGLFISGPNYNIVKDTFLKDLAVSGMELNNTDYNKFLNLKFLNAGQAYRFVGTASHYNKVINSVVADSEMGVNLTVGGENLFYNLKIYNSYRSGVNVTANTSGNRFVNVYSIGSRENGVKVSGNNRLKLINIVSAFNRESGVSIENSIEVEIVNLTSFRNASLAGTGGFLFSDTDKINCTNCLSSLNNNFGFIIGASSLDSINNRFHGNLIIAGNGGEQCEVVTSPNLSHGIIDSTCTSSGSDGSTDFSDSNSTATFYGNIDLTNSFIGTVSSDSVNTHGSMIPIDFSSITDWFNFENNKRFWINQGASLVIDSSNTHCDTGANCEIWDMNLIYLNSNALFNSSYDFLNKNEVFMSGNCPAAVAGSEYVDSQMREANFFTDPSIINGVEDDTDGTGNNDSICEASEYCFNRYLKHAYEISDDNIGDNDGLCEANESCVYTPNWAEAYTSANLTQCTFVPNGGIENIEMWVPDIN
ncbi:MAG: hypothetical protein MK008_06035 [Bdellovibrionales bacterium]|nr:hypothetical protein [Bdellovibrionales bacterium]